jgi:hypothetical protein
MTLPNGEMRSSRALRLAVLNRPWSMVMTITAVPVGVAALLLGEDASRAFTIIGGGGFASALIPHLIGALLLFGGFLALAGVARHGHFWEALGLSCIAAGSLIYGFGVLVGLGLNGLIAGGLGIGNGVGAGLRAVLVASLVKRPPRRS